MPNEPMKYESLHDWLNLCDEYAYRLHNRSAISLLDDQFKAEELLREAFLIDMKPQANTLKTNYQINAVTQNDLSTYVSDSDILSKSRPCIKRPACPTEHHLPQSDSLPDNTAAASLAYWAP